MKLDYFLKCKKVKCVKAHYNSLTVGKEYSVLNIRIGVEVIDDAGSKYYWRANHFEPVLEPAENPPQDMELTPEFEAVEPKFKVGDKVYFGFNKNIEEIERFCDFWDGVYAKSKSGNLCPLRTCCHATQENYALLSQLYPHIEFELPPLTGNELCRKLLDKGEKYIMAKDDTDTWRIICDYCDDWFTDVVSGKCLKRVTPVNSKGEPLTEAVLDE